MTPPLWKNGKKKQPFDESERGKWKSWLKTQHLKKKDPGIWSGDPVPSLHGKQIGETMETVTDFIFGGFKITADGDCSHEIKRRLLLGSKVTTNLDSILKSRDITLPTKGRLVKAMVFPVVMYGCESWTIKKAEHRSCVVVLEKTLQSPLDSKESKPVHPKGNQSWIFIGRTDAESETPILWPPGAKNWLIGKDPDDGKDWRWEQKGSTYDEMVGWYHLMDISLNKLRELVMDREACGAAVHRVKKIRTRLSDWTELSWLFHFLILLGECVISSVLSCHSKNL